MILDLFAGPGGWEEGLRLLGHDDDVLGVEKDRDTALTAVAAGHPRLIADVRAVGSLPYAQLSGLLASPPCQSFSLASKVASDAQFKSRASLVDLSRAICLVLDGAAPSSAALAFGLNSGDPRSTLVLEPARFIRDGYPVWVAMENVPGVLPVWAEYATLLRALGYSTWAGTLNAADYGVPQSRRRAFLLATKRGDAQPPTPTHDKTSRWGRLPWVTMAEALELGEEPDDLTRWAWHRPATTVVRSFSPEVIAAPGYRRKGDPPRQRTPGSITVTREQMCVLQGLRPDYPFRGKVSKIGSLIGAVLPPPWAAAILAVLVGQEQEPMTCEECGNDDASYGCVFCPDCREWVRP